MSKRSIDQDNRIYHRNWFLETITLNNPTNVPRRPPLNHNQETNDSQNIVKIKTNSRLKAETTKLSSYPKPTTYFKLTTGKIAKTCFTKIKFK